LARGPRWLERTASCSSRFSKLLCTRVTDQRWRALLFFRHVTVTLHMTACFYGPRSALHPGPRERK
jgi:hypothetical protein